MSPARETAPLAGGAKPAGQLLGRALEVALMALVGGDALLDGRQRLGTVGPGGLEQLPVLLQPGLLPAEGRSELGQVLLALGQVSAQPACLDHRLAVDLGDHLGQRERSHELADRARGEQGRQEIGGTRLVQAACPLVRRPPGLPEPLLQLADPLLGAAHLRLEALDVMLPASDLLRHLGDLPVQCRDLPLDAGRLPPRLGDPLADCGELLLGLVECIGVAGGGCQGRHRHHHEDEGEREASKRGAGSVAHCGGGYPGTFPASSFAAAAPLARGPGWTLC
jgi:hypothetical protein